MKQRVQFIAAYESDEDSMSELCRRFGVSRRTGYKWLYRYVREGPGGLADRTSRPRSSPGKVFDQVEETVVAIRRAHPRWGPKKIGAVLEKQNPGVKLPAVSTMGEVLKRNGLVLPRRRSRKTVPRSSPFAEYQHPNAVWCADFKGDFRVGAKRCYPLTIIDGYSRFLIACKGLSKTRYKEAQRMFYDAFVQFGIPEVMRSDNGPPFATRGAGGLSKLSVWFIRLGIQPERIEPGHPEQNGRQERFHRTLGEATASPAKGSMSAQQRAFNSFGVEYNHERPHEALGQEPPAKFYERSTRELPHRSLDPEYGPEFECYRTSKTGAIEWRGWQLHLNKCLDRELVGVTRIDEHQHEAYFGPVRLGTFRAPRRRSTQLKMEWK